MYPSKLITVKFQHECLPRNRAGVCKCLPTVSTCEKILSLPVNITTEEEMMSIFKDVLICETGFGLMQSFNDTYMVELVPYSV